MKRLIIIVISFLQLVAAADKLLIPMDQIQKDHLKAYGIAFWTLEKNINIVAEQKKLKDHFGILNLI